MQEYDHEFKCLMKDNERFALLSKAIDEGVMTYETAARLSGWDEKEFRRRLNRWRRTKKS